MKTQNLFATLVLCVIFGAGQASAFNILDDVFEPTWNKIDDYIIPFAVIGIATIVGVYAVKKASGNIILQLAITAAISFVISIAPMSLPGQMGTNYRSAWSSFVGILPGV